MQASAGGRNRDWRRTARARGERDDGIFSRSRAQRVAAAVLAVRRGLVRHRRYRHHECAPPHHDSGALEAVREGGRRNGVARSSGAHRRRRVSEAHARIGRGEGRSARRIDRSVHRRSRSQARTPAGRGARERTARSCDSPPRDSSRQSTSVRQRQKKLREVASAGGGNDEEMTDYTRREQFGWCMYDFANSAFYTTVITLFLGPYLTALATNAADASGYVHPLGIPIYARSFWSFAAGVSVAVQVLFLP